MRQGLLFSIIVSTILCAPVLAYDWSTNPGSGEADDPYQISTPEQLTSIGSDAVLLTKHYILMNDIVFDPNNNPDHVFDDALIAPYQYQQNGFAGSFDGNGYSIINLKIIGDQNLGLFGIMTGPDEASVILKNLTFVNPEIRSNKSSHVYYLGFLVGTLNKGRVDNCHILTGRIVTTSTDIAHWLGGIAGLNEGDISNCTVHADFLIGNNSGSVGGITGSNSGYIKGCLFTGQMTGQSDTHGFGGIAGNNGNIIWDCQATVNMVGGYRFFSSGGIAGGNSGSVGACQSEVDISGDLSSSYELGGLVGSNSKFVYLCQSSGKIDGYRSVGGLVGKNTYSTYHSFSTCVVEGDHAIGGLVGENREAIFQCYAMGHVTGVTETGGLLGSNTDDGYVSRCYSTGLVKPASGSSVGGLIGDDDVATSGIWMSYWDIDTSQQQYSDGGMGLYTYQMTQKASYHDWHFLGDSFYKNEIWRMCSDGVDYPRLSWEFAQNGDFACDDGVDILDLEALADHWLLVRVTNPTTFSYACDANGDQQINLEDFAVLGENW